MRRLLLALLVMAPMSTVCGRGAAGGLEWDLRGHPTPTQIGWAGGTDSSWNRAVDGPVRLLLDDRTVDLEGVHDLSAVSIFWHGERLDSVQVDFVPEDLDAAFARIDRLTAEWGFDRAHIDAWMQLRRRLPPDGGGHFDRHLGLGNPQPLTEAGLLVGIGTRYSFHDRRPVIVTMHFSWPSPRRSADNLGG